MSDLISRQAAIDALRAMQTYKLFAGDDMLLIDQAGAQTELMLLPPAQPTFDARDTQYNIPIGTDLISRQAVIDAITASINQYGGRYTTEQLIMWGLFVQMIQELPSAQPT